MLEQKLKDIHKRVSEDLEVKKNLPASFKNILSIALSGLTYTVIEQLKKSEELLQIKAKKDNLHDWGKVYGVQRLNHKKAELVVTLTSNKKLSLERGELLFLDETSQAKFLNEEILEIIKGENKIKATAENPGYIDLSKASISLNNSHENIETDVTFEIISQGLNKETDDNYRRRILNRIVQIPQSGTITDFIEWIERGDPQIKAFVKPNFSASFNRPSVLYDSLIVPDKFISPNITVLLSSEKFNFDDISAAATAKSAAGSDVFIPPAILR